MTDFANRILGRYSQKISKYCEVKLVKITIIKLFRPRPTAVPLFLGWAFTLLTPGRFGDSTFKNVHE